MKATKAQIELRVNDLVTFRLDGAQFWHVREYVREKEKEPNSIWHRGEGQKPLSDATLWRYIGKADALIADSCRSSRKKLLRGHVAKRRNLFAKAISQNDLRTALAAADSEAKLLGLHAQPIDHMMTVDNVKSVIKAQLDALREILPDQSHILQEIQDRWVQLIPSGASPCNRALG
jgi:hypothetical protein